MLVIGNGESRKTVDISNINDTLIGCNAILRDYFVRHLVCVDRKMVREAISKNYNQDSLIYTREDWFSEFEHERNLRCLPDLPYVSMERPDQPIHWGSGPYAVLLSTLLVSKLKYEDVIHIVGFDLYGLDDNKVNNIYKDTENYDVSSKTAVDPRYWIHQIAKVFEYFPDQKFIVYNTPNWNMPKSWKKKNIVLDTLDNLSYNINSA